MPNTWREIIRLALVELGVLVATETPAQADIDLGFTRLKQMLEAWAIEGLLINGFVRIPHEITESKQIYTIGPAAGADISLTHAPTTINAVGYQSKDSGMRGLIRRTTQEMLYAHSWDYDDLARPTFFAYDNTSPTATLRFNHGGCPGDSFVIMGRGLVVESTIMVDDDPALPLGYSRAIMLCLAVELAPSFGVKGQALPELTTTMAMHAKSKLRGQNLQPFVMVPDPSNLDGRGSHLRRTIGSWRW